MADQNFGFRSIVFPALGTGVLKYPADVVARLLIESTTEYVGKNRSTNLKEVHVIVFQADKTTQQVRQSRSCAQAIDKIPYRIYHGGSYFGQLVLMVIGGV